MKNKFLILSLSLFTLISCVGCQNPSGEREVVDLANRTVKIPNNPSRIICIGAGMLRLFSYFGDVSALVGVEDIEKTDNAFGGAIRPYREINKEFFATLPTCGKGGPSNQSAEPETILSCRPDLILSMYSEDNVANELQQKIQVPVVTFSYGGADPFSKQIASSLTLLGTIFHKETRANELNSYIKGIADELDSKTKDVLDKDKSSIYLGCLGNYGMQDIFSSCKKYPLFEVSNIKNPIDDGGSGYVTVDKEALVAMNMDKMILDAGGLMQKFKLTYEADPTTYNAIKAIKNDEVYVQMPYNAYYTNIEIAIMDAYYDALVSYPTIFQDVNIETKSNEISKMFLGLNYYDEIAAKSYGGFQKFTIPDDFNI